MTFGTAKTRIVVAPGDVGGSYEIILREGLLEELAVRRPPFLESGSFFIVTDSNVSRLYGNRLLHNLSGPGRKVRLISFPAGERSKSMSTAMKIAAELDRHGAWRESRILALGGGVVGDLAGFVASIYKRGIDYVQVPTTLLAQVDSSIGGKTGVNAPWGKNQLGSFKRPMGVLTDPAALRTLPRSEVINGLAEVVKCAVVADEEMFEKLWNLGRLVTRFPAELVVRACRIKAVVVSQDERESNIRAILNFGHTVGHALEAASGYRLGHGYCVTQGMLAEAWIASQSGIMTGNDYEKVSQLILGLARLFPHRLPRFKKSFLVRLAKSDKKSSQTQIRMSLPEKAGKMHSTEEGSYLVPVPKSMFEASIDHLHVVSSGLGQWGPIRTVKE